MDVNQKPLILAVDDESALLKAYARMLRHDYEFIGVQQSEEALETVIRTNPDLVMLDVSMPGLDGYSLCRQLKKEASTKYIPVIFATALGAIEHEARGFEVGAVDFIHKPIAETTLKARINTHLRLAKADLSCRSQSDFFSTMVHELRTALHATISFNRLAMKTTDAEKIIGFQEKIDISARHMQALVNNLLDISKLEAGRMVADISRQDLQTVINQVVDQLDAVAQQKQLKISLNTDNILVAEFDHHLLTMLIANLLSNAIKFSPARGRIALDTCRCRKRLKGIDQDILRFSVFDEGPGIPVGDLELVFDKFYQVGRRNRSVEKKGTGLGLPIVREIANLHQGRVWAESPPPGKLHGTAFHVEIPVQQI